MDRNSWRAALENGSYELLNPESKENVLINGEEEPMEMDENHVKDRLFYCNISSNAAAESVCEWGN